jgi:hypothetical protein
MVQVTVTTPPVQISGRVWLCSIVGDFGAATTTHIGKGLSLSSSHPCIECSNKFILIFKVAGIHFITGNHRRSNRSRRVNGKGSFHRSCEAEVCNGPGNGHHTSGANIGQGLAGSIVGDFGTATATHIGKGLSLSRSPMH